MSRQLRQFQKQKLREAILSGNVNDTTTHSAFKTDSELSSDGNLIDASEEHHSRGRTNIFSHLDSSDSESSDESVSSCDVNYNAPCRSTSNNANVGKSKVIDLGSSDYSSSSDPDDDGNNNLSTYDSSEPLLDLMFIDRQKFASLCDSGSSACLFKPLVLGDLSNYLWICPDSPLTELYLKHRNNKVVTKKLITHETYLTCVQKTPTITMRLTNSAEKLYQQLAVEDESTKLAICQQMLYEYKFFPCPNILLANFQLFSNNVQASHKYLKMAVAGIITSKFLPVIYKKPTTLCYNSVAIKKLDPPLTDENFRLLSGLYITCMNGLTNWHDFFSNDIFANSELARVLWFYMWSLSDRSHQLAAVEVCKILLMLCGWEDHMFSLFYLIHLLSFQKYSMLINLSRHYIHYIKTVYGYSYELDHKNFIKPLLEVAHLTHHNDYNSSKVTADASIHNFLLYTHNQDFFNQAKPSFSCAGVWMRNWFNDLQFIFPSIIFSLVAGLLRTNLTDRTARILADGLSSITEHSCVKFISSYLTQGCKLETTVDAALLLIFGNICYPEFVLKVLDDNNDKSKNDCDQLKKLPLCCSNDRYNYSCSAARDCIELTRKYISCYITQSGKFWSNLKVQLHTSYIIASKVYERINEVPCPLQDRIYALRLIPKLVNYHLIKNYSTIDNAYFLSNSPACPIGIEFEF